jgi:hypothetical protein
MQSFRRLGSTVAAAMITLALTAGLASSHECFNASRVDRANAAISAHSHGWFDIQTSQFLAILVLSCIQQPGGECPPPPSLSAPDLTALQAGNFDLLVGEILGFAPREAAITDLLDFTARVATEAACLGVPTHFVTLANSTAAGGAGRHNGDMLTDGKGIDHFPEVYGPQVFGAYQTVLSGGPSACR